MANVLINDAYLENIADAIRVKSGTALGYKPREMANAIYAIPSGGGEAGEIDNLSKQLIERTLEGAVALDVDKIGRDGLAYMNEMTSLTCTATIVQQGGIAQCDKLISVNLPNATFIGQGGLSGNKNLIKINVPSLQRIDNYAFGSNTSLETLDLGSNLQRLVGSIANNCGKLSAIIIRTNYVPDCAEGSNPFPTNFKNTYTGTVPGYIYVPKNMMVAYQGYYGQPGYGRYDYWTMQNYRAIEDYPEICG